MWRRVPSATSHPSREPCRARLPGMHSAAPFLPCCELCGLRSCSCTGRAVVNPFHLRAGAASHQRPACSAPCPATPHSALPARHGLFYYPFIIPTTTLRHPAATWCIWGWSSLPAHHCPIKLSQPNSNHNPPPPPCSNLVYMGMGEPLHNLPGVLPSVETLCQPLGLHFSYNKVRWLCSLERH